MTTSAKRHISILRESPVPAKLMPTTVAPASVRRRILLLLLLGVDRPDDLVLPPVVQAFEVVLPGRVADVAVAPGLRFQALLVLRPEGVAAADAAAKAKSRAHGFHWPRFFAAALGLSLP
eukprot:CAMPEP_0181052352 /NCGR_PEP_ID=MMETSP1070-20121207/17546_1 /TAXON_ID=265543 /ORGANISM="Minutocellus polymorphus, Strain NH13" /LENGTH=119 /DNA_ID=CAMNT_0023131443 /DNA_START=299 /DNA_END=654 /DNA_ORIENTATION=-